MEGFHRDSHIYHTLVILIYAPSAIFILFSTWLSTISNRKYRQGHTIKHSQSANTYKIENTRDKIIIIIVIVIITSTNDLQPSTAIFNLSPGISGLNKLNLTS